MTGWQAGPVSCCSAAVARHAPFLEHSMAVSQHLSPKAGQAGGWSPGLGDHSCCHSQHSHSLPGSGHMTCVTQVASPTLCGDDSEARLAEATWEESSGLRAHASPHPLSCGGGVAQPRSTGVRQQGSSLGLPTPNPHPEHGDGEAKTSSSKLQSLAAQTPSGAKTISKKSSPATARLHEPHLWTFTY